MKSIRALSSMFVTFAVLMSLTGCSAMMSFLAGAKDQADQEGGLPTPMTALRILLSGLMQVAADNSGTLLVTGGTAAALQHAHSGLPFTERRARIKKEDAEWEAEVPHASAIDTEGK